LAIQICTQYTTTVNQWIYRILGEINFSQSVGCDHIPVITYKKSANLSTYRRLSYKIPINGLILWELSEFIFRASPTNDDLN